MRRRSEETRGRTIGWGCLSLAIVLAVLIAGLAVIFVWDVNSPH
jgi:hypothetical protein